MQRNYGKYNRNSLARIMKTQRLAFLKIHYRLIWASLFWVCQKAYINYSIITSCSRERFIWNCLNSYIQTCFWQKTAFSHHEIIYQRPAVCLQQKAMMWKIISMSGFLWNVNNKKVGAFSDHQALQKLPVSHAGYEKKSAVKNVDRWMDGKTADSSLRFIPSDPLFQPCVTREYAWMEWRSEGQTESLWHPKIKLLQVQIPCQGTYLEIATCQDYL